MTELRSNISILSINVNGLNLQIKKIFRVANTAKCNILLYTRDTHKTRSLEVKNKRIDRNSKYKLKLKSRVAILVSDKMKFKSQSITETKETIRC